MIYFSILSERNGAANYQSFNSLLDVCCRAGVIGALRIGIGYTRTDEARNLIVRKFREMSENRADWLVMLDGDHLYPYNILEDLTDVPDHIGVVAALAHRRGEPYEPMFYYRTGETLHAPAAGFERGPLYECQAVATSCIAIRRRVFDELETAGYFAPFFRYQYDEARQISPSEDMYFSRICELAKIGIYCDTGIEIPHATIEWIDAKKHEQYSREHNLQTFVVSE